jgi:hypothetical protein
MKLMITILIAVFTCSVMADEPSVAYKCKDGFKQFKLSDKARFDVCPIEKDKVEVDIISVGGNYHTCWWNTKPNRDGDKYVSKESDCEVNFTINNETLQAEFIGACRNFCGARAGFRNGRYAQKTSNK